MVEPTRVEVPDIRMKQGEEIVFMLDGPDGKQLIDHSYDVIIGDDVLKGSIASEGGLVIEPIVDDCSGKIKLKWAADNYEWGMEYYLEKDNFDTGKGQSQRLNNMFFAQPSLSFAEELAGIDKCDVMGMEKYEKAKNKKTAPIKKIGWGGHNTAAI